MKRRIFISRLIALTAGLSLLSGKTSAASKKGPRPPGTCGGWSDPNGNGCCERSEKASGCGDEDCPGHVDNSNRKRNAKNGAPEGACAGWEKSEENFCKISLDDKAPCTYAACPANKNHA